MITILALKLYMSKEGCFTLVDVVSRQRFICFLVFVSMSRSTDPSSNSTPDFYDVVEIIEMMVI